MKSVELYNASGRLFNDGTRTVVDATLFTVLYLFAAYIILLISYFSILEMPFSAFLDITLFLIFVIVILLHCILNLLCFVIALFYSRSPQHDALGCHGAHQLLTWHLPSVY